MSCMQVGVGVVSGAQLEPQVHRMAGGGNWQGRTPVQQVLPCMALYCPARQRLGQGVGKRGWQGRVQADVLLSLALLFM
jgi:hypothetical protein